MIYEKLAKIQSTLVCKKDLFNSFGKYSYRSTELILEAVKPLLNGLVLTLTDDVVMIGDRYYIKATVTLTDGKEGVTNTAYAREENEKRGMDASQLTGATSSYARKYALAGLFLLDDNKDADATNDHGKGEKAQPAPRPQKEEAAPTQDFQRMREEMESWFRGKYGAGWMLEFKNMTKGAFDSPEAIKNDKNVAVAYKHFIAFKEGK